VASTSTIRTARSDEAAVLTGIAMHSKASWGYDADFLAACVPGLTVSPERIARDVYFLIEVDTKVAGFGSLLVDGDEAELTNLFVEPWALRQGYGEQLWQHAMSVAKSLGITRVRIESDPYAEGFYKAMGAERIGEAPSDAIPGRMIPLLLKTLP
jgi:ribosomal protein S18 acetylase RimI-like enzyme